MSVCQSSIGLQGSLDRMCGHNNASALVPHMPAPQDSVQRAQKPMPAVSDAVCVQNHSKLVQFVHEHLKPAYKAHTITKEAVKWVASKTANKVCPCLCNALAFLQFISQVTSLARRSSPAAGLHMLAAVPLAQRHAKKLLRNALASCSPSHWRNAHRLLPGFTCSLQCHSHSAMPESYCAMR